MDTPISFPGLHLSFNVSNIAFSVGNYSIKWYGILIALGMLLALLYGMKRAPQFNITVDDLSDVVIFSIILGVVGARLYYVIFYAETPNPYFQDPLTIFQIWNGGLGIYGGIIASFVTAFIVCKIKKISVGAIFDIAALGFLIGQAIGRWGNFFNREAYGGATGLPWRMVVDSTGAAYHPCFLYESLWCIVGFVILHKLSKHRKFNGETFLMYVMWYGFGRFFIEGLRSDSLMIGTMKVSQLVAVASFVAALILLLYKRRKLQDFTGPEGYSPVYDDVNKALSEEFPEEQPHAEDLPENPEENPAAEEKTETENSGEHPGRTDKTSETEDKDKTEGQ